MTQLRQVSQELTDTTLRRKINAVARSSGMERPGGEAFGAIIDRAVRNRQLTLFVPWAAPPSGGKGESSSLDAESRTIDWLTGVCESLGDLISTKLVVMFADTYADRNGYSREQTGEYFRTVQDMLAVTSADTTVVSASQIENDPFYQGYLAQEAYGLASLSPAAQETVVGNAARYQGLEGPDAYGSAADYVARRRAEARWVAEQLGALTITLNGSNGNAALEGLDVPMASSPISLRTPWLRGN